MADKVATIRMKLVGLGESSSELEKFTRQYSANMVQVQKANEKVANLGDGFRAGTVGIDEMMKATERLAAVSERASRFTERAGVTDQLEKLRFLREDLASQTDKAAKVIAADPSTTQAAAASEAVIRFRERAQAEETKILTGGQAEKQKVFNEGVQYRQKAAAEEISIVQKANDEEQKIAQRTRANSQKAMTEEVENWAKVESEKADIAQKSANAREEIEKRHYAATHTRQETELRNLSEMYAEKRVLYEKDAATLQMLNETEAAERQAIMTGGAGGLGLKGFGGRMIIGMAVGRAAGDIIGDKEGGQEIGSLIAAFAFLNPAIASAVGLLDVIGLAFKAERAATVASTEATKDWINTLADATGRASELATGLVKRDAFGGAMEKEESRAFASVLKNREELAKMESAGKPWLKLLGAGEWEAKHRELEAVVREDLAAGREARDMREEEDAAHLADIQKITAAEERLATVEKSVYGPMKERAEISAKIELADAKRVAHNDEEIRQLAEAVKIGKLRENEAADAYIRNAKNPSELKILKAGLDEAIRTTEAAQQALAQVQQQQKADDTKANRENELERNAPAMREHYNTIQQVERDASEAHFIVEQRHAKTMAEFREAKHAYDLREARRENPAKDLADIEAEVSARESLERLKEELKPPERLEATDRFIKGFVDFKALGTHGGDPALAAQQRQTDLLTRIEFNTRPADNARRPLHFSDGGQVGGGVGSGDTVPAMLADKEIVINPVDAQKNRALLLSINAGNPPGLTDSNADIEALGNSRRIRHYAQGGEVDRQTLEQFIDSEYGGAIARGGTKTVGGITLGKGGDFDVQANLRAASKRAQGIQPGTIQKPQDLQTRTLIENAIATPDADQGGNVRIGGDTRGLEGTVLDPWEQKNYREAYERRYGNVRGQYGDQRGNDTVIEKSGTGVRTRQKTEAEKMADWDAHDKVLEAQMRYEGEHGPQASDSSITQGMSNKYHHARGDPATDESDFFLPDKAHPAPTPTPAARATDEGAFFQASGRSKGENAALGRQHSILEHKASEEAAKGHKAAAARYLERADKIPHDSAWAANDKPGAAVAPQGPTPFPGHAGGGNDQAILQSIDASLKELVARGHGPS